MPSEEEIALLVQKGDHNALAILVERHHSPLLGFLYRMTGGDRVLAEDMAQESFLRVIRSIGSYQYPRPFKPWLYAIATNIARDYYKRVDYRITVGFSDQAVESPLDSRDQPEARLLEKDEERHIAAALAGLPEHQREAVVLRYYQELSLAEIADALSIPVGTVKSRLSLGLSRLKTLLEKQAL